MKFDTRHLVNGAASVSLLIISISLSACHSQSRTKVTVAQLTSKAQEGDSDAQFKLGLIYELGSSETPADKVEAAKWFKALADKGDRRGENALGLAYLHGDGVTEDDAGGFELLYKAALKGYPSAQDNLGRAYNGGRGTPKNPKEAFNWFVEAARNGDHQAQSTLCRQYQSGVLVESDPVMAYAWCLIAKESGSKDPALLESFTNKANAMLSATEADEAKQLASSWNATHKSGGTMPIHSRSFISSVPTVAAMSGPPHPQLEPSAPEAPKKKNSQVSGCESGHWVDSVLSDGEIVKLEDGSIWRVDSADTVDSSLWLATEDVVVCGGKLINTDDNSTVGAHRIAD